MTTQTMDARKDRTTADWLCLAAAPTFAILAMTVGLSSTGPQDVCGLMHSSSPLSSMTGMYLLMSAFHSPPWLQLLASRRTAADPASPTAVKVGSEIGRNEVKLFKDPRDKPERARCSVVTRSAATKEC
jgi:hypothetical protein